MAKFGFSFGRKKGVENLKSPVALNTEESSLDIDYYGGVPNPYATTMDFDRKIFGSMSENALIEKWRQVSYIPIVDNAIEEIISDMLVMDGKDDVIKLELEDVKYSDKVKDAIQDSFQHTLKLLSFNKNGHQIARRFYVDGRLNYALIIDNENTQKGIQEIRYVDPKKIKKVREIKREGSLSITPSISKADVNTYYMYSPNGVENIVTATNQIVKLPEDTITYVSSGLVDQASNATLSWVHKALRPANIMRMVEDAAVIYRLHNSTERRIFYIEVGELPAKKAEEYLQKISAKYKNKVAYDTETGEMRDDRKHLSVTEDFWIPRRSGQDGTQIDTIRGGANLGEMDDVEYFKQNLYDALNVPKSRFEENAMFSSGTNVSRDEMKFSQFIYVLRQKFNHLFIDIMRKHMALTGIMSYDDWEEIEQSVKFIYNENNYFSQALSNQIFEGKLSMLDRASQYEGKILSREYIMRKVMHFTDDEIKDMQKQIEQEKKQGLHKEDDNPL